MRLVQRPLRVLAKVTTLAGLGLGMVCGLLLLLGGLARPVTAAPLAAPCNVNSDITANTTWTSGSTCTVSGLVNVITGVQLTIEPGVVVSFTNRVEHGGLRIQTFPLLVVVRHLYVLAANNLAAIRLGVSEQHP